MEVTKWLKPSDNSGGGKGPQFKTAATSGEGFGDWATYQLRKLFRNCRRRYTRKRRQKLAIASTRCTTRSAVKTSWLMRMPSAAPCLLYTSDAADEEDSVDLGGRRIIK